MDAEEYHLLLDIKQRVDKIYLEQDQQRERLARIEKLLFDMDEQVASEDLPGMTVPEAAEALGVSERTIFNYIKAGKLRNLKIRGRIIIDSDSIEALKKGKEEKKENN